MSKKTVKLLSVLAGIAAAIGFGIAFFKKRKAGCDEENEFSEDFEDEDFDLDNDFEPIKDREYISLDK